jgi:predicted  nucleic acid-binding Zn-ribbon protein
MSADDIETLKEDYDLLLTKIDAAHTELSDLDTTKISKLSEIQDIADKKEQAELEYNLEVSSYEKEVNDLTVKLSTLKAELNHANKSLLEVKKEESSIRNDIADSLMRLNKREESIQERESKVSIDESRLFNYKRFTDL